MKYIIDSDAFYLDGPYITLDMSNQKRDIFTETVDLDKWFLSRKDLAPLETGILPLSGTGLLAINRGFGFEQIIYQIQPGISLVRWGKVEGDPEARLYQLAFPYRILFIDYKDGHFQGIRHFYSPDPITSYDQPLYLPNVPNTNCMQYRGTSLGWLCMYHNANTKNFSFHERVTYAVNRYSGTAEPYNDDNMRRTDGIALYDRYLKPAYMTNRTRWEQKTLDEGYEWMLDPSNLIVAQYDPFIISSTCNKHLSMGESYTIDRYSPHGTVFTVYDAAYKPYSAYYDDVTYVKPWMPEADRKASITLFFDPIHSSRPSTVKDIHWAIKTLANPIKVPFSDDVTKYLSDDVECMSCMERFPPLYDMKAIIVGKGSNSSGEEYYQYNTFCTDCFEEYGCYIEGLDEYVIADMCFYDDNEQKDYLLEDSMTCPSCLSVYHQESTIFVWTVDENVGPCIFACRRCVSEDVIQPYDDPDRWYLISECTEVKFLRLQNDSSSDSRLKYIQVSEYHTPSAQSLICHCGFLFKDQASFDKVVTPGTNTCKGCVNELGEVSPIVTSIVS